MIVVRDAQLALLAAASRHRQVANWCRVLRADYPARLSHLPSPILFRHVDDAVRRAHRYGLRQPVELRSYLELLLEHGWDVEQRPDGAWMRDYLTDSRVGSPGERLRRLLARQAALAQKEERDERRREWFERQTAARK